MKRLCIAAATAVLCACTPSPSATAPSSSIGAVQEQAAALWPAETRTILAGDEAQGLTNQCSRISPGPVEDIWTPGETEIDAVERELVSLVTRELEKRGESPSPGGYYRQIVGFVIGGRRVIYVNGLANSFVQALPRQDASVDWRTDALGACDGGSISFGVEYDPATRRFSNFAFNGAI